MSWSAHQYSQFETERNRPVVDLLSHLPEAGVNRAVDIGCGSGNSTGLLRQRYPQASIYGIDSSADMIAVARRRLPAIDFQAIDIDEWRPDVPPDLILANAVLQWLPDHERLFPRLLGQLAGGGRLAVQMPDNLDEPAHVLMREVASWPRWAGVFDDVGTLRAPRHDAAWYVQRLDAHAGLVDVWCTTYYHRLAAGIDGVVEWFKGSALRPYLDRLSAADEPAFLAAYREALDGAYPILADGAVLLPFPRLFILVTAEAD
ncbi:trans-aconitate 2-methyltransferase [Salinisphaera sp. RV14]|uniref:trans-aconitate 2-methyltransferase n=1 Tax=Salinisphaera sp. RV14 TaxID=3454140 RepID=UPI003F830713